MNNLWARRANAKGFTLLELLTVMAIITLLLTVALPAVNSLISGSRLTSAGNLVASLAAQARQEAMAKNTMTALVLLANQGSESDGRAVTILHYDPVAGWQQPQPWEILPEGVLIDIDDTTACTFMLNSPQPFPFLKSGQTNPPARFHHEQLKSPNGYAARVFLPRGGLANAHLPAHIRLIEGRMENGRLVRTQAAANYYDITIIGDTGQIKIDRP